MHGIIQLASRIKSGTNFRTLACVLGNSGKPSNMSTSKPIETAMTSKLTSELTPSHLEIINESYMHNVPKGSETHFKVVVVSDKFEGQSRINRHRLVNGILKDELQGGVHALSIVAETTEQWKKSKQIVEPSPTCLGGFGK